MHAMNKTVLIAVAGALALAACGPSGGGATAVRVSDVACETAAWDEEVDTSGLQEIYFQGDDDPDVPVGVMVRAAAGSSCEGTDATVLTCQLHAPAARFAIQDWTDYKIPEGRTATFRYAHGEGATCFLNEEG